MVKDKVTVKVIVKVKFKVKVMVMGRLRLRDCLRLGYDEFHCVVSVYEELAAMTFFSL